MIALLIGYEAVSAPVRACADPFRRGDSDRRTRPCCQCRQRLAAQRRRASRPSAMAMATTMRRSRPWPRRSEADRDARRRSRARSVRGRRSAALPAAAAEPGRLSAPPFRSRPCGRTGARQTFAFVDRGGFLESVDEIPEPHAFAAKVKIDGETRAVAFEEHEHAHGAAARDNNLRAAFVHVIGRRAVSVLVIVGLVLARAFGWLWMDPLAGIVGAFVIASWSAALIRDTGADPARHESGPPHGGQSAAGDRGGRRPPRRSASLAARPRPSRRDRLGGDAKRAKRGRLSRAARALPFAFASDDRGQAGGVTRPTKKPPQEAAFPVHGCNRGYPATKAVLLCLR